MSILKNSFNGGELDAMLRYRVDLDKYASACAAPLINFWVTPYGGIQNRPGMIFVASCHIEGHPVRILPFRFSATETAIVEIGHNYIKIVESDIVLDSPYSGNEIFEVDFVQNLDVIFLCHGNHPPQMLKRLAANHWTIEQFTLKSRPWRDSNLTDTTLTASATTGNAVTLTASADYFESGMVGSRLRILHNRSENSVLHKFTGNGVGPTFAVKGAWTFRSFGSWVGTLHLQRSTDNGSTFSEFRIISSNADDNADETGFEENSGVVYRVTFSGWQAAPEGVLYECRITLKVDSYYHTGEVEILSVTDAKQAVCNILSPLYSTNPSNNFALEAWSDYQGWPSKISFFTGGDRLRFDSTRTQPQTFFFSATSDYNAFEADTRADSAMIYTVRTAQYNEIRWSVNKNDKIIVGMANAIGVIEPRDSKSALSVENRKFSVGVEIGAAAANAVVIDEVILFLRRGGRQLMELSYNWESDGYVAPEMTLLASGILSDGGGADAIHFRSLPYPMLFVPRRDGVIACFTYNRGQNVTAWSRIVTDGVIESVATLPTDGEEDEVWFVVKRGNRRFIEKMAHRQDSALGCFLDSSLVFGKTDEINVPHLAGRKVTAMLDGGEHKDILVDADGSLDLPETEFETALIGLPYVSVMTTLPLELSNGSESTMARPKRIPQLTLKFYKTLGGSVSISDEKTERALVWRKTSDVLGQQLEPKTESFDLSISGAWRYDQTITVYQRSALPMTLLALVADYEVNA